MNKENLQTLATFLYYGRKPRGVEFDMERFADGESYLATKCGTAGCAVGWGPFAGIAKQSGEEWQDYSERCFIPDSLEWFWCFDADWAGADNTRKGAAKRIQYLLDNGEVPEGFHSFVDFTQFIKCYKNVEVKR